MLIRTSAPTRQVERMLEKRDWRRRLASRQTGVTVATLPTDNVISVIAAIELGVARKPHRPARSEKAAARASALPRNLQLQGMRRYPDEETALPR